MKKIPCYPLTIYGLLGLLLWAITAIANIRYDDSGFASGLFFTTQIFRAPFWVVEEIMFGLNGGSAIPAQSAMAIGIGLGLCFVIDHFVLRKLFCAKTLSHR